MRGFGNFKDIDKLKECTEAIEKEDVVEIELTDEQKAKLENVTIPAIDDGAYVKEEPKTEEPLVESSDAVKNEPEEGAAGNKEKEAGEKEKEPIMGGMGMSMGMGLGKEKLGGQSIAPEMEKKGLEEGFDQDVTVDEDPTGEAKKRTEKTMTSEKMKELNLKDAKDMMKEIDEIRGATYDFDSTKDCGTTISNKPIDTKNPAKKIPKGW